MTATVRPSLEARAGKWLAEWHVSPGRAVTHSLNDLLAEVQSEAAREADTRLQTAVTTMEQATQGMLAAQAEVVELRAALRIIAEWKPPDQRNPHTGEMQSMAYLYGSHGERDYFREFAGKALDKGHGSKALVNRPSSASGPDGPEGVREVLK